MLIDPLLISGAAAPIAFLVGDVCYADNYLSNGTVRANFPGYSFPFQTYQPRWDTFGRLLEPLASQYAYMVRKSLCKCGVLRQQASYTT